MNDLKKYPRTQHIEGSRLQAGDQDLRAVPFAELAGRHLVVEEKLDGANSAISFDGHGELRLQSRGHFLRGGASERQFDMLKTWAHTHHQTLRAVLGGRYVLYGEWLYAKHTIFYDRLPHYFLEFDVLDTTTSSFLSTPRRRELLAGAPIVSVPVLAEQPFERLDDLTALIGRSLYKRAGWRDHLVRLASDAGRDSSLVLSETDPADEGEGLYVKWEEGGCVRGRYKFIRPGFLQAVLESGSHWQDRPILANQLADGVDLFGALS